MTSPGYSWKLPSVSTATTTATTATATATAATATTANNAAISILMEATPVNPLAVTAIEFMSLCQLTSDAEG
jgi:hypothetical protein